MPQETRFVFLCRHGHRINSERRDWHGADDNKYDPYLSKQGNAQAKMLARRLRQEPIDKIFSSPYLRALQTASHIAEAIRLPVCVENGLGEWLHTEWLSEDPRIPDIQERALTFPRVDLEYRSRITPVYPETEAQLKDRLMRVSRHLLGTYSGNLLIVGHGKTVSGIAAILTGIPDAEFSSGLCCLTKLEWTSALWKVVLNGDTSHLTYFSEMAHSG